jgi:hypothetical protein
MRFCVISASTYYIGLGNGARYSVILKDLGFPIYAQMRVSYLVRFIWHSRVVSHECSIAVLAVGRLAG